MSEPGKEQAWWGRGSFRAAVGFVLAVAVVLLVGARLTWPAFWLIFVGLFREQVAELLRSLSDWVELKYKDLELKRALPQAEARVDAGLARLGQLPRLDGEREESDEVTADA